MFDSDFSASDDPVVRARCVRFLWRASIFAARAVRLRMLPPLRCFTCNRILPFTAIETDLLEGAPLERAMSHRGLERLCCRRMVICNPPEIEEAMVRQKVRDQSDVLMNFEFKLTMRGSREYSTD